MKKNINLLEIPNINSKDAKFKKLIYNVEDYSFNQDDDLKGEFEHLCICLGPMCVDQGYSFPVKISTL